MSNFIVSEILSILESQRSFIDNVKTLTNEQLNWTPSKSEHSKRNTVGILLEHITGAEKFLVHRGVFGKEIKRNRDEEFNQDKVRNKEEIISNYKKVAMDTAELLKTLKDDTLTEERKVRTHTKSVSWILLHAIEHNYYHIGQINYLIALMKEN